MPPRITQNDKREQTGRIPGQLERVQRQTRTTYKTAKQVSQFKPGTIKFGQDAPSAYGYAPSIATNLVNALRPLGKIVEQGTEVRDRIDKEKFDDIFLFAQSTNANPDLGYEQKLELISKAYGDFKPMSRKYQIAAHTQKTRALQELNGVQDKLRFSDWATKTIQASMSYPVNPQDDSMSREEFLVQSAADLRTNEPQFDIQSRLWADGQQQQIYKKQFEAMNNFASLQADIILKSKDPSFFSSAGNQNQFMAELETVFAENGYDPRTITENQAIMENIDNKYSAFKSMGNTIVEKEGQRTNLLSGVVSSTTNNTDLPFLFDFGLSPTEIAASIVRDGEALAADPSTFIPNVWAKLSGISRQPKSPTEISQTLSAFPSVSFSPENQELVRNIQENPEWLSDKYDEIARKNDEGPYDFQQKELFGLTMSITSALGDAENLFKQRFKQVLGPEKSALLDVKEPDNLGTPPPTGGPDRAGEILNVINNTGYVSSDDQISQQNYILSQSIYYSEYLRSQAEFNQYDEQGEGVGNPVGNSFSLYESERINSLIETADLYNESPSEKNLQSREELARTLDKQGLLISRDEVNERARFFSNTLVELKKGISIGGNETQQGGRYLNGVLIAAAESGMFGNSMQFLEDQEIHLRTKINMFLRTMRDPDLNISTGLLEDIELVEAAHTNATKQEVNYFGMLQEFERLSNQFKNPKDPEMIDSFKKYKTNLGILTANYAKQVEESTQLITASNDSFELSSDSNAMIPFLSGTVASKLAFDARNGSNSSTVPQEAMSELASQITKFSDQTRSDMYDPEGNKTTDFDFIGWREKNAKSIAAISNLFGTNLPNNELKQAAIGFVGNYLGLNTQMLSGIQNLESSAPRNRILADYMFKNGRVLSAISPNETEAARSVMEGFQSYFISPSSGIELPSFGPGVFKIASMSNIFIPRGVDPSNPATFVNHGFNMNIPNRSFVSEVGAPLISMDTQQNFGLSVAQAIAGGALQNRDILTKFVENGQMETALHNGIVSVTSLRDRGQVGPEDSMDLLLSILKQNNTRVSIGITQATDKGNKYVTEMVKASMKEIGATDEELDALGNYTFDVNTFQGTADDQNTIQFNAWDPTGANAFRTRFVEDTGMTGGMTGGYANMGVINHNTQLSQTSVPISSFYKVTSAFENLLTDENNFDHLHRHIEGGAAPQAYLDLLKMLASPRGETNLLGGRRFTGEDGVEMIEEGMSLFALNQLSVLYTATAQIKEKEGLKAALDFLKDTHDNFERTSTSTTNGIFAYENINGTFYYMVNEGNRMSPYMLNGNGNNQLQLRAEEFRDRILLHTGRRDVPQSKFNYKNYPNFWTYKFFKEEQKKEAALAETELRRLSRGSLNTPKI